MTSSRTQNFSFFCLPGEFEIFSQEVLLSLNLKLCIADRTECGYIFRERSAADVSSTGYPVFYACTPGMVGAAGTESLLDILQIWAPEQREDVLRMGEFTVSKSGSTASLDQTAVQIRAFAKLKQAFKKKLKPGVWGQNSKTSKKSFYKDIYISDAATAFAQAGNILAPKIKGGFVSFYPE